jgi:hypothetical protein
MFNRNIQLKFVKPNKGDSKTNVVNSEGESLGVLPDFETVVNAAASLIVVYVITDTFRRIAFARALR